MNGKVSQVVNLLMWYMCRFVYEEKLNQKEKTLFVNSTTPWDRGFELNEN